MTQEKFEATKDSLFIKILFGDTKEFLKVFRLLLTAEPSLDLSKVTRRNMTVLEKALYYESDKHGMLMSRTLIDYGAKLIDYKRYYRPDMCPNYKEEMPLHCLMHWFGTAGCSNLHQNIDLFKYVMERISWDEFTTIKDYLGRTAHDILTGGTKGKDREQKWNKDLIVLMRNMKTKDAIGSKCIQPSFLEARKIKKLKKQYNAKLDKTQTAVRDIESKLAEKKANCIVVTL